jgi:two-component system, chemotaxis family, sensor kinase CheA
MGNDPIENSTEIKALNNKSIIDPEFWQDFVDETSERIEKIGEDALILEDEPENIEAIHSLFREFHTIKGISGMVKHQLIQEISHKTETLMSECRVGNLKVNKVIVQLIVTSADFIKKLCENIDATDDADFIDTIKKHLTAVENRGAEMNFSDLSKSEHNDKVIQSDEDHDNQIEFIILTRGLIERIESDLMNLEENKENDNAKAAMITEFDEIKNIAEKTRQNLAWSIAGKTSLFIENSISNNTVFDKTLLQLIGDAIAYLNRICNSSTIDNDKELADLVDSYLGEIEKRVEIKNVNSIIDDEPQSDEEVDPEFMQDFLVEAKEHIESIEVQALVLENEPENIETIHSLFREFHTIKGLAGFVNQILIQEIAHQTETMMGECRNGNNKVTKAIVNLILNSADFIKKICDSIDLNKDKNFKQIVQKHLKAIEDKGIGNIPVSLEGEINSADNQGLKIKKLGEILVDQKVLNEEDVTDIIKKQQENYPELKLGQVAIKEKKAEAKEVVNAIRIQENAKTSIKNTPVVEGSFIRIPTYKVDNLVDMMGELIIMQSLVEQEAGSKFNSNDNFTNNLLRISRITKDMQNIAMSLRMVSLKSTFQKINRIGRDTISELGKNASIIMIGEETEIDRGVAEKILDPLVHLIKNSISHGIENEKERIELGKTPNGTVKVEAYSKRGNVYIEVSDDGKGIDLDRVHKKAIEKGLVDPSVEYDRDEIMNFIFLPGFSTAEKVDNISGRGVGLDVVRTEIFKSGGKVEIDSHTGLGSVFTLKIPINMAVMNGTIIDIMGSNYILPTLQVKKIFKPLDDQWVSVKGRRSMIRVRDEIIQLIPVAKIFGFSEDDRYDDSGVIIVLELEQKLRALPIRKIIGKREIVVKSLGSEFSNLNFVSGASILGDGKVSLILDIETLFRKEVEA